VSGRPERATSPAYPTLKCDPARRHIPLVLVTGMEEILQHDCQSYLATHGNVPGPDAVLGKPIDPAALLAVLERLCGAPAATTQASDAESRPDKRARLSGLTRS
jgi:CheY-like chemotaxis protein